MPAKQEEAARDPTNLMMQMSVQQRKDAVFKRRRDFIKEQFFKYGLPRSDAGEQTQLVNKYVLFMRATQQQQQK